jgi:predicted nucleic acid-binding Zn ribbon protein
VLSSSFTQIVVRARSRRAAAAEAAVSGGFPQRLGDVLRAALARLPVGQQVADHAVWLHWDAVVGPTIARHARPLRLRRGTLVIGVDGASWMQELQFLKHEVRTRLNARLGRAVVREVFLVLEPET